MRTRVLVAAIGAAAVLGGLVGAGATRAISSRSSPSGEPGQWWCSSHICTRDQDECAGAVPVGDTAKRMQCERTRIAYCAIDGINSLQCVRDWHVCQGRAAELKQGYLTRCVGVE